MLVNGKQHPQRVKDKHEYHLIQRLITRVGTTINYNHQELLNYGLDKKNKQVMAAVSGDAGIGICYKQLCSAEYRSDWPETTTICGVCDGA
jgi:ribose 1,5-bisphosphokinase PhnN